MIQNYEYKNQYIYKLQKAFVSLFINFINFIQFNQNFCSLFHSKFSLSMFSIFKNTFKFTSQFNKIVYVNGKSMLSLSQMIGQNGLYTDPSLNNFYIKQHTQHEIKHEGQIKNQILQNQAKLLQTVLQKNLIVRCIISPQISKKQMNLNINKLKKNPLLHHLIQLRQKSQFKFNAPRILVNSYMHIDQARQILQQCQDGVTIKQKDLPVHTAMHGKDPIKQQVWVDKGFMVHQVQQHLKKNIVQIQKLFSDGLGLDISFMLSKRNLHHQIKSGQKQQKNFWLNCISKKSKAIHSNIIQNGLSLSDTIYQEGYQLHHLFLSSFNDKKQRISYLDQNKAYDLKQIIYILSMINFNGKLVIDCQNPSNAKPQQFSRNAEHLDKILKQMGYKKTLLDQLDDGSYISAL